MPIRQGGRLARRWVSWGRESLRRSTMAPRSSCPMRWKLFLPRSMPSVAMAAEEEDRDMGRAPCVARSPTAYEQAGQKHGRTIPLADHPALYNLAVSVGTSDQSLSRLRSHSNVPISRL